MTKNKIILLPQSITNKIAAGEVVQRPASVIKELLENSLDAGAENIDVYIKRAGKSLIQVVDDGSGMSEDDALECIKRHATSKIEKFEDLEKLNTFGFRGEALSSIAAVSAFELKTEQQADELGTFIRIDTTGELQKERGAYSKGTSIAVKNLFYNTPARRNFLKTNATELKHILDNFKRISITYPNVAFKLYNDDDLIFDYPKGSFPERLQSVFADNILDAVIEVKEETDFISLNGYIAKPNFLAKNRGEQYFFINNRFVISRTVSHAVFSAYEHILDKGDYPFFVLMLKINPKKIDVNVHPQKLEVKFDDEKDIYTFVQAVIKKSLGSFDLVPNMSFSDVPSTGNEKLGFSNHSATSRSDFTDRPMFGGQGQGREKTPSFSDNEIDLLFSSINDGIKSTTTHSGEGNPPFGGSPGDEPNEIHHSPVASTDGISEESSFIVALHNKYIYYRR